MVQARGTALCTASRLTQRALDDWRTIWPIRSAVRPPVAWALGALHQLISFGGGLREIATSLLVLTGFAAAANAIIAPAQKGSAPRIGV